MTQLFDIRTSILFQEGQEFGLVTGIEQGLEQGSQKNQLITIANHTTRHRDRIWFTKPFLGFVNLLLRSI